MKFKTSRLLLPFFLFCIFIFLTLLVFINGFDALDIEVTKFLQNVIPRSLDTTFSLFSLFGSFEMVSLLLLLIWYLYKKLNLFYVLILFGLFHILELLGKLFINHPNPPSEFSRYAIPFSFPSSSVNTGSSFPSGHMGRTIFISIILGIIISRSKKLSKNKKRLIYLLIFLFDFIMFISRIYLGEHWFSDILGATILGASFALLILLFF